MQTLKQSWFITALLHMDYTGKVWIASFFNKTLLKLSSKIVFFYINGIC